MMSESLVYLVLFALIMYLMHRGHGGGCMGHDGHGKSHVTEIDSDGDNNAPKPSK